MDAEIGKVKKNWRMHWLCFPRVVKMDSSHAGLVSILLHYSDKLKLQINIVKQLIAFFVSIRD
jgi:hypothetical protein